MKKEKGITLIALIVTIIILIILATVSINIIWNDNGIIKKAQDAKDKYIKAEAKEILIFAISAIQIDEINEEQTTLQSLHDKLPTKDNRIEVEDYIEGETRFRRSY